MIKLGISRKSRKYEVYIHDRVSVIFDSSGAGKTLLCDTINGRDRYWVDYTISDGSYDVLAFGFGDDIKQVLYCIKRRKTILVIDEDFIDSDTILSNKTRIDCMANDCYILLITRDIPWCSLSPTAILTMTTTLTDNNDITEIKPSEIDFYTGEDIDVLVCEDSSLGLEIISNSLNTIGCSSNGNANISNLIMNHIKQDAISKRFVSYVVDGSVFGKFYNDIYFKIHNSKKVDRLSLFMPPSFEYLLIKSTDINSMVQDEYLDYDIALTRIGELLGGIWFMINSFNTRTQEQYYTSLLCHLLNKEYGFKYNKKGNLPSSANFNYSKFINELYKWRNCYWLEDVPNKDSRLLSPNEFINKFS